MLKELEEDGNTILVKNAAKRIKKVFEITELDKVFGIND